MDAKQVARMARQGWQKAESLGAGAVMNPDNPLEGVIKSQHHRVKHTRDLLNIGSGTRC